MSSYWQAGWKPAHSYREDLTKTFLFSSWIISKQFMMTELRHTHEDFGNVSALTAMRTLALLKTAKNWNYHSTEVDWFIREVVDGV